MICFFSNKKGSAPAAIKQNPTISGHVVSILKNGPGGSVSGMNFYTSGQTVTITATPTGEFSFKGWMVVRGGITLSSTTATTATFTMPNNDVEIYAIFIKEWLFFVATCQWGKKMILFKTEMILNTGDI